jgi:glycosyltransferase involved in cell wall biosynthesis
MTPISVTIITKNEAERLPRCLASIQSIADEVLVVDSGSSDATCDLARAAGARVIHNDWPGYGPQKRFAQEAALHDFILNLDADEWLTSDAIAEIAALKARDFDGVGFFRFRIPNVYPADEAPRLLADENVYIRLYDRRRGGFPESLVFDEVKTDQPVVNMKGTIWHKSIQTLDLLRAKELRYFRLQAQEIAQKPLRRLKWLVRIPFEYPAQFIKYYLFRRHITGGLFGLRVAHVLASVRTARLSILLAGPDQPD